MTPTQTGADDRRIPVAVVVVLGALCALGLAFLWPG
jgi:hypothetical protein